MNWRRGTGLHLAVLAGYVATALVFSWPLALHLSTHLTGPPDGDTGVYVWNQWVFQHEILVHRRLPFFTDAIFSMTQDANLSLHNYTAFQNLLALPLSGWLGVVATFNVVFLLMSVLTAYATFLLARHVTGRPAESWLAGLLFAWSPLLVTRGMGHFSLVAAAPLAIFLLVLMKADGQERFRDAAALGAVVAWAATTDVYYGVYCLLIGAVFLVARIFAIQASPQSGRARAARWAVDVCCLCRRPRRRYRDHGRIHVHDLWPLDFRAWPVHADAGPHRVGTHARGLARPRIATTGRANRCVETRLPDVGCGTRGHRNPFTGSLCGGQDQLEQSHSARNQVAQQPARCGSARVGGPESQPSVDAGLDH